MIIKKQRSKINEFEMKDELACTSPWGVRSFQPHFFNNEARTNENAGRNRKYKPCYIVVGYPHTRISHELQISDVEESNVFNLEHVYK